MEFGLKQETIENIKQVFVTFSEIEKVILYGSRAKGTSKPASDIDLIFVGKKLDIKLLHEISLELDDLFLPYIFDISLYQEITNEDLLDHLNRVGKLFYEKLIPKKK